MEQTIETIKSWLALDNPVDQRAREILVRIGFFAPDAPLERDHLFATLRDGSFHDEALARLLALGLLESHQEQLTLHPLLLENTGELFSEAERQQGHGDVLLLIDRAASEANASDLPTNMQAILPHLLHALTTIEESSAPWANLACELGTYLSLLGAFGEAETYFRKALKVCEDLDKQDETQRVLRGLTELLRSTDCLDEAIVLARRVLHDVEALFGAVHPMLTNHLDYLASLLKDAEQFEEAELLVRRILAIDKTCFGGDHPDVARDMVNLAEILLEGDGFEEAERLIKRALVIDEAALGPNHTAVARDLKSLASLFQFSNRVTKVEPLLRRALAINEATFGADHPQLLNDLDDLALFFQDEQRFAEADQLLRRALTIAEVAYGGNHPDVAMILNNLGLLLRDKGEPAFARPYLEKSLAILESYFGPDNPYTQTTRENLEELE